MANEVQDLQNIRDAVVAHNTADVAFQDAVNQAIAALKDQITAGADMTQIDAAIAEVQSVVDAKPVLTLPQ